MSLSEFSKDGYDSIAWINKALEERPEDEAFEGYLASLAMRLHMTSQDYTDQLESAMVDATQTIPRVQTDITRIEDVLKSVSTEMQELAVQLQVFDQRNVAGVEELSRLDMLRRNMETCKNTLEEHARWSQVVREAKTFLEGGGRLADSADRICTMARSLKLLERMPGHDERELTCQVLSESLLSAVRPRVTAAVAVDTVDVPGLLEYFYVYQRLGRLPELHSEYIVARSQQRGVLEMWASFDGGDLATFYKAFARSLASFLAREGLSLAALFTDHQQQQGAEGKGAGSATDRSTAELLCDILTGVAQATTRKDLPQRFEASASPEDMAGVYAASNVFATLLIAQLAGTSAGTTSFSSSSTAADSKTGDECALKAIPALLRAVYEPLAANLEAAHSADGRVLRTALHDAMAAVAFGGEDGDYSALAGGAGEGGSSSSSGKKRGESFEDATGLGLSEADVDGSGGGGSAADPIRQCVAYAEKLVEAAGACVLPVEASLERSGTMMAGVHYRTHVRTVTAALAGYVKKITAKVELLRRACGLSTSASTNSSASSSSSSSLSSVTKTSASAADAWVRELEVQDLIGTAGTREVLPAVLLVLQAAGSVLRSMESIDACSARVCEAVSSRLSTLSRAEDLPVSALKSARKAVQAAAAAAAAAATGRSGQPDMKETELFDSLWVRSEGEAIKGAADTHTAVAAADSTIDKAEETATAAIVSIGTYYASHLSLENSALGDVRLALRAGGVGAFLPSSSPAVSEAAGQLRNLAGCLFLDTCTALPERLLQHYSTEPAWEQPGGGVGGDNDEWELVIDDNLLPQPALTQCGEHLLSLVQDLEMFSASSALQDLATLSGSGSDRSAAATAALPLCRGWSSHLAPALVKVSKGTASTATVAAGLATLSRRASCVSCVTVCEKVVFGAFMSDLADYEREEEHEAEAAATAAADGDGFPSSTTAAAVVSGADEREATDDDTLSLLFVNQWLGAFSDALVGALVAQIVQIKTLSPIGRAQLAVDLDYLSNVVNAVGLRVHPLLLHVRTVIASPKPGDTLLASVEAMPAVKPVAVALRLLDMSVARAMVAGAAMR